jgi:hypothetical protein
MTRFIMEVEVQHDDPSTGRCDLMTRVLKVNVTAEREIDARRMVLERAWFNGLLVSRFNSISQRSVR